MLHNISLPVLDLNRSSDFYDAALAALGYRRVATADGFAGYGLLSGKDKFALKSFGLSIDRPLRDEVASRD